MKFVATIQFFVVLFILTSANFTFAQTDEVELNLPKDKAKKYNLTFRLDHSIKELDFKNKFSYEGEYFKSIAEGHIWQTYDTIVIDNNKPTFKEYGRTNYNPNFKFDLLISIIEPLNIGLTYHLLNKRTEERTERPDGSFSGRSYYYTFFALAGVVDYKIAIKPIKRLYLNPSVSFGAYQAYQDANLFSGVGKEWYTDIKMALLYNIGNKLGIRVFADYSNWLYREKSKSTPFPERDRIVKGNVSSINFGAGLSYRFFLIPD